MLIVIEGCDAAGKNTQAHKLIERAERNGWEARLYSFPRYDTPVGRIIREFLQKEKTFTNATVLQTLMVADKLDVAEEIVDGAAFPTRLVVLDRWWPASHCYGLADGLDVAWLRRVQAVLPAGDLNLFLDLDPEEALRRRPEMQDRYERDRTLQATVRDHYHKLWKARDQSDGTIWRIVDAGRSREDVHEAIWKEVVATYNARYR